MAIHFLDTPLKKALAFFPNFGGWALLNLTKELTDTKINNVQKIYLRTLMANYCKISMTGSGVFAGLLIAVIPQLDTAEKLECGIFLGYIIFTFLTRIHVLRTNAAALSQLRVSPVH